MPFAADVAALVTPPHAMVAPAKQVLWRTIAVRPGDTLWDLAITHRTTVAAIVAKNRLARGGAVIHVGQKLLVPGAASTTKASAAKPATTAVSTTRTPASAKGARIHVVRSGETMSAIAQRYHVGLTKLLAANRLRATSYIYVGQRITVPGTAAPKPRPKPAPDTSAVARSKARLAATDVPSRAATEALIRATATRHGIDPKLALAIGWIESGWYQRAVSHTNAVGVMQIMPMTGTWASQLAGRRLDLYDVRDNITAGVLVLRSLQALADSRDQAIAAYYQGLHSVRTRGLYTDTEKYVATVKAVYARL